MYRVDLPVLAGINAWRSKVRPLLGARVAPEDIVWSGESDGQTLFGESFEISEPSEAVRVPPSFFEQAAMALCHSDPHRFDLLYRIAYRLQSDRDLLNVASDPDIALLGRFNRAVRRDSHKMKAFVRFRAIDDDDKRFAAWFEPDHYTLEMTASFFAKRFSSMNWAILTPYQSVVWNGEDLQFGPGARKEDVPADDGLEMAWRTYFASIFNPARLKIAAMQAEMPRKYWRNLPEAECIPDLIRSARKREVEMIASGASQPPSRHVRQAARTQESLEPVREDFSSLASVREAITGCTRCPLYAQATQAVFGEGPAHASVMVVGEQPGDSEDLTGRPFVGPAGKMFDGVLDEVRIDRKKLYVTNAVKHFKFVPRGKRRLHQKPNGGEVKACRFWLEHERALIKPKIIVAMGATAAQSLLGSGATIGKLRGTPIALEDGTVVFVTVHPSYLLRIPDRALAASERAAFASDLAMVRDYVESASIPSVALDSPVGAP